MESGILSKGILTYLKSTVLFALTWSNSPSSRVVLIPDSTNLKYNSTSLDSSNDFSKLFQDW